MPVRSPLTALVLSLAIAGCVTEPATRPLAATTPAGPDYARPLSPGRSALRPAATLPDLAAAYSTRDGGLLDAIERSLEWFRAPSSKQFFPFEGITHEQARASLQTFRDLLETSRDGYDFAAEVSRLFDVYESVGYDGRGTVLFTGYYAPIFKASRTRRAGFESPLYRRPEDLVTDPVTGEPQGRRLPDGSLAAYPSRAEIERSGMLHGNELVWLENDLAAYIVHVNGSAKLRVGDEVMYVGYAGKTDRPYASLGRSLVDRGLLRRGEVTLAGIKRLYRRRPDVVRDAMLDNENYVFFTEYERGAWPAGSLGVQVTPERSVATDKKIYPRGGMVLVDTAVSNYSGDRRSFLRFMLDQDTGGAIKAPGRADLFMGIGPGAEILAGAQHEEGRLYYLFLKPEYVDNRSRSVVLNTVR